MVYLNNFCKTISFVFLLSSFPLVSIRADNGGGVPVNAPVSSPQKNQDDSEEHLVQYVSIHALLAGAVSQCSPQLSDIVRQCLASAIVNWNDISGLPPIKDVDGAMSRVKREWEKNYNKGVDLQQKDSPPSTCSVLIKNVEKSPIFGICHPIKQSEGKDAGAPNNKFLSPPYQQGNAPFVSGTPGSSPVGKAGGSDGAIKIQ